MPYYVEYLMFVFLWFSSSISLTFLNKYIFSVWNGGFRYPLLISGFHMLLQSMTVRLLLRDMVWSKRSWKTAAVGVSTGLDIGLSNVGIGLIPVIVYTLIKSGTTMWVLFFSLFFKLREPTKAAFGIIAIMCVGVALSVYKPNKTAQTDDEAAFLYFVGVCAVLAGTILAGLRWAVTQILLNPQKRGSAGGDGHAEDGGGSGAETDSHELRLPPLRMVAVIAPYAASILLPLGVIFEGKDAFRAWAAMSTGSHFALATIIGGASLLALTLVWSEFRLVRMTSALALAVLGVVKEVTTILLSVALFKEHLFGVNAAGMVICIIGVLCYNYEGRRTPSPATPLYLPVDEAEEFEGHALDDLLEPSLSASHSEAALVLGTSIKREEGAEDDDK